MPLSLWLIGHTPNKMRPMLKRLWLLWTFVLTFAPGAQAGFLFGAQGGVNLGIWSSSPSAPQLSNAFSTFWGVSGYIGYDFVPILGVELGGGYIVRGTGSNGSVAGVPFGSTITTPSVFVPFQIGLTPTRFIKVLLGGYYSYLVGAVSVQTSVNGIVTSQSSGSHAASGMLVHDLGLVGGVRGLLPLLPFLSITAEGRFAYGLTNLATASGSFINFRDLTFLAGLQLTI